jgi:tRNA (guanine-N7-)-methyltransferase
VKKDSEFTPLLYCTETGTYCGGRGRVMRALLLLALVTDGHALSSSRYRNPMVKPAWYKRRQRHITPAQKRAEKALWPRFGLTFGHECNLDLDKAFAQSTSDTKATTALPPRVLEIGCGNGEAITQLAAQRPEAEFVGVDWLRRGLASCCMALDELGLENVRLVRADAATLLTTALPEAPLFSEVLVFFPDPWYGSPERRLIRPDVVDALGRRMRPGGCLRVGTDVYGYPEEIKATMAAADTEGDGGRCRWHCVSCAELEAGIPGHGRPSTRYEREAIEEGRPVEDLCFVYTQDQ